MLKKKKNFFEFLRGVGGGGGALLKVPEHQFSKMDNAGKRKRLEDILKKVCSSSTDYPSLGSLNSWPVLKSVKS